MENKKNKILVIAFILTLNLITACTITTTRNQYYDCPHKHKDSIQATDGSKQIIDTMTIIKNE